MTDPQRATRRPISTVTRELSNPQSPVRQFLDAWFTTGVRGVQKRYRESGPELAVPPVPREEVNPGTLGTAADWLLRLLLHPSPSLDTATKGARACRALGIDMDPALLEITQMLGMPAHPDSPQISFTGPTSGSTVAPNLLVRCCWALALLTEPYRAGFFVLIKGPLAQFRGREVSGDELLALTPLAGIDQLAQFRDVFEATLIPNLASKTGSWTLGPDFSAPRLINADGDLIAAGLLLDLKTSARKLSLARNDLFQLICYVLLDFDDTYRINELGVFRARYAHLATWELGPLLDELAGGKVDLPWVRQEFRKVLSSSQC